MFPWLAWTLVALFSWGFWAVLSKLLDDALSPGLSQTLSTLGLLPLLAPLAWSQRAGLRSASRRGTLLALLGGTVTCLGNVAYYAALGRGGKAATVVSLAALAPLVTLTLALVVLRERLNRVQVGGALASLVALWLFNVQPDGSFLSPAVAHAILPITFWGLSGFLQKHATNHLNGPQAAFWYLAAFLPVALWYGVREPWPAEITARTWTLVLALGFFLALGNLAVLAAFARGGKASVISPLSNLFPLVSLPLLLLLGEKIGEREWTGIAVALLAAVGLAWESKPKVTQPAASGTPVA